MAIPTQTATPGTPAEPGSCLSAVAPDLHTRARCKLSLCTAQARTGTASKPAGQMSSRLLTVNPLVPMFCACIQQNKESEMKLYALVDAARLSQLASDKNFAQASTV